MDKINFKNLTNDLYQKKMGHSFQLFSIDIFKRDIFLSQETRSAISSSLEKIQDGYSKSSTTSSYTGDVEGMGAMHSSKGTALSAEELLKMTPPEVLRFLIANNQPDKHLVFDSGLGLLNLVDEYDKFERVYFEKEEAIKGMMEEGVDRADALRNLTEALGGKLLSFYYLK